MRISDWSSDVCSSDLTKTADVDATLQQIYAVAAAGYDIVRCTCNEPEAAEGLARIIPRSPVPIVADIHHQYKGALEALDARSEEPTSEHQSQMRIPYAVVCVTKDTVKLPKVYR